MAEREEDDKVQVVVGDPDERGARPTLCLYEDRIEVGECAPLKDGVPLNGKALVELDGRAPFCRMRFLEGRPKGPAKVNSKAYQAGWESIFGKKEVAQA